jgi:hypothetical protein
MADRPCSAWRTQAAEVPPSEFALIGGFAVMTRQGGVRRVTDDPASAGEGCRSSRGAHLVLGRRAT